MNKSFFYLMLAAVALVACSKNTDTPLPEPEPEPTERTIVVTAGIESTTETRINYTEETGEGTNIYTNTLWDAGEEETFALHSPGAPDEWYTFTKTTPEAGKAAQFSGIVPIEFVAPATSYGVYLPNPYATITSTGVSVDFSAQNGLSTGKHLMVATVPAEALKADAVDPNIVFQTKVALMKITLKDEAFVGKSLTALYLTGQGLRTDGTYTFGTDLWESNSASNTIVVSGMHHADADGAITLYVAQPVGTSVGDIEVYATIDQRLYNATLAGQNFSEARIYSAEATHIAPHNKMKLKIRTTKRYQVFTLPIYDTTADVYDLTIDWGDPNNPTPSSYTGDLYGPSHMYSIDGEYYTITITANSTPGQAQMPQWEFGRIKSDSDLLISLDTPMLEMARSELKACFYQCINLQTIHPALFAGNPQITHFEDCFIGCTSLREIPAGLFAANTMAIDFSQCFVDCYNARINPNIFCDEDTQRGTRFENKGGVDFQNTFLRTASALPAEQAGTAPALWTYTFAAAALPSACFSGCGPVTNIADIPGAWMVPQSVN